MRLGSDQYLLFTHYVLATAGVSEFVSISEAGPGLLARGSNKLTFQDSLFTLAFTETQSPLWA